MLINTLVGCYIGLRLVLTGLLIVLLDDGADFEEFDIFTPVNAEALGKYLGKYHLKDFICNGFKSGFSLGMKNKPRVVTCPKVYPARVE